MRRVVVAPVQPELNAFEMLAATRPFDPSLAPDLVLEADVGPGAAVPRIAEPAVPPPGPGAASPRVADHRSATPSPRGFSDLDQSRSCRWQHRGPVRRGTSRERRPQGRRIRTRAASRDGPSRSADNDDPSDLEVSPAFRRELRRALGGDGDVTAWDERARKDAA